MQNFKNRFMVESKFGKATVITIKNKKINQKLINKRIKDDFMQC